MQGQIADLKAMTAFKDLQIRKASLSEADFSVVAIHGDLKLLEKIENHSTVSNSNKTTAEAATETGPQADSNQAATSRNNSATTVEASGICGCAIHVLKSDQLRAVEALQGACQKFIEAKTTLLESVNRKGKHFPKETVSSIVFVFNSDPQGILANLKWLKYPVWIYQGGGPDVFNLVMGLNGAPPMLCRFGKVSGFGLRAFTATSALRQKYPELASVYPVWVPDASAMTEEDVVTSLCGSADDLDTAVRMLFAAEVDISLADCEIDLLGDQDIQAMRVQGKMLVFAGNRKKLLPESVGREAYRLRLD